MLLYFKNNWSDAMLLKNFRLDNDIFPLNAYYHQSCHLNFTSILVCQIVKIKSDRKDSYLLKELLDDVEN